MLIREKKENIDNPVVVQIFSEIVSRITGAILNKDQFDYRMFKYAALVLLEIVESQTLVSYLDIAQIQQAVQITSYFAIWYSKADEISPNETTKVDEVQQYFAQIVYKLQSTVDK